MDNFQKIFFGLVIIEAGLTGFLINGYFFHQEGSISGLVKTNMVNQDSTATLISLDKLFIKNRVYDEKSYNCVNYSMDFKQIALRMGYEVTIIQGCKNETVSNENCHVWIRLDNNLDLEPQEGVLINYSIEYPYQLTEEEVKAN